MRSEKTQDKPRVACIGIGVMGGPIAAHILRAGFPLTVFNRTQAKAKGLMDSGAAWAPSIACACKEARIILTILGGPEDVRQVYLGSQGLIESAAEGTILVDMTTSDPQLAREIEEKARERGIFTLDAPVTGGQRGAIEGRLSILVGGPDETYAAADPLLRVIGTARHMGESGNGQLAKLANQIAIASTMLGVCEALVFIKKNNLDPWKVLEGMNHGAASSWILQHMAPRMLKEDAGAGLYIRHFINDLKTAREQARRLGLDCPGLEAALERYRELQELGGEELGTQALYQLYADPDALERLRA